MRIQYIKYMFLIGIMDDGLDSDDASRDKHDRLRPLNPARPMAGKLICCGFTQ